MVTPGPLVTGTLMAAGVWLRLRPMHACTRTRQAQEHNHEHLSDTHHRHCH